MLFIKMLHTQLDQMEPDSVTVHTKEGHGQTELKLHCLTCMMKSWLRMKRLNNSQQQQQQQHSRYVDEIGFDYVLLVMGTYVNANIITFWSVRVCV